MIIHGDCLDKLKEMADSSVDSVVTDPPYGLKFMGKKWDYDVPVIAVWTECLRVLKPGGHLLSFGGTRTYHRLVVAIEDAGFEIRDQIQWIYGSGFPKSHDVSKAIDKMHGAEREVVGENANNRPSKRQGAAGFDSELEIGSDRKAELKITAPATPDAIKWQGWGTALKPANEPIVLARKPLEHGLTVAENVLKWGCGGLNIEASRIGNEQVEKGRAGPAKHQSTAMNELRGNNLVNGVSQGRWPANLILDECAAEMLDEQSGVSKSAKVGVRSRDGETNVYGGNALLESKTMHKGTMEYGDTGGASRFFYVAKASKRERNHGCEGMAEILRSDADGLKMSDPRMDKPQSRVGNQNHHPTVKPIKLMEYLIKLITPPGGLVLDPFAGSGSTGVAAIKLGFEFIGIEMNDDYVAIAEKRIAGLND